LGEYEAASALERAAWKVARDETAKPHERLLAFARWRKAADQVKVLAVRLLDTGDQGQQASPRDP
jgi:hypothetical protein